MEEKELKVKGIHHVCKPTIQAIHDTLDVIGGKWKISIIGCLTFQPMRFSELLREVNGISGKMLSRELKDLELNQLVKRTILDTQPITVLYQLTPYGETLKNLTINIAEWGFKHRIKIIGK